MKLATITTFYNEEDFLPHFLAYYADQVDTIFAIDNGSDDRSLELLRGCPKAVISTYNTGGKFNCHKQDEAIRAKMKECIGEFKYVILPDPDEFVEPKNGKSIRAVLTAYPERDVFGTAGFNIFTYPWEPPLDPSKPLIEQRRLGRKNDYYSKPIISRPNLEFEYSTGRHYIFGLPNGQVDTRAAALFNLLHYRGFDERIYLKRCMMKKDRHEMSPNVINYGAMKMEDFMAQLNYEKDAGPPVRVGE